MVWGKVLDFYIGYYNHFRCSDTEPFRFWFDTFWDSYRVLCKRLGIKCYRSREGISNEYLKNFEKYLMVVYPERVRIYRMNGDVEDGYRIFFQVIKNRKELRYNSRWYSILNYDMSLGWRVNTGFSCHNDMKYPRIKYVVIERRKRRYYLDIDSVLDVLKRIKVKQDKKLDRLIKKGIKDCLFAEDIFYTDMW